jgi:hypothetical protein
MIKAICKTRKAMTVFSTCGQYRFRLEREIPDSKSNLSILFIMLNPSTATSDKDDNTIKILQQIATKWGYGKILVGNLYPYCTSKPSILNCQEIPAEMQEENIKHVREMVSMCDIIIYAWGTKGPLGNKQKVPDWLQQLQQQKQPHCLGTSVKGIPKHPKQWGTWIIPEKPILFSL